MLLVFKLFNTVYLDVYITQVQPLDPTHLNILMFPPVSSVSLPSIMLVALLVEPPWVEIGNNVLFLPNGSRLSLYQDNEIMKNRIDEASQGPLVGCESRKDTAMSARFPVNGCRPVLQRWTFVRMNTFHYKISGIILRLSPPDNITKYVLRYMLSVTTVLKLCPFYLPIIFD